MTIQGLGYVGVRAKSLEDWAGFGEKFLGLQLVDKSRGSLAFRMDDRKQRVVVVPDGGEGVALLRLGGRGRRRGRRLCRAAGAGRRAGDARHRARSPTSGASPA